MKKLTILITLIFLFLILFISCNSNIEYDYDTIRFNVRKYIISEDLIDYNDIKSGHVLIDSLIEYPKYKYLENRLDFVKRVYDNSMNEESPVKYLVLQIFQNEIDSLSTVYKNTNKDVNYYKCYFKIEYKAAPDYITSRVIILNEKFIAVGDTWDMGGATEEIDIPITEKIK